MNELTLKEKDAIRGSLQAYCAKYPSQNRATGSLKGVSAGTVSTLLSGRYENISDEMFRNIASQVGGGSTDGWQIVETNPYRYFRFVLEDAQQDHRVTWVISNSGCGKSTVAELYAKEHKEVFYILCNDHTPRIGFVHEIARIIGVRSKEHTLSGLWDLIIDRIIQMDSPLIIFDEANSPTEQVFSYFKTLYNLLFGKCGIVFLSTDQIKERMSKGLRRNRPNYQEIYSRINRKFYEVGNNDANDVYAICVDNGVRNKADIGKVISEAKSCDFDLRRVRAVIHGIKVKNRLNAEQRQLNNGEANNDKIL
jgi:DNA transposition AAA+ family ATPase